MNIDPTIVAGCIGAAAMFVLAAIAGLIGWGRIHETVDGVKGRLTVIEGEMKLLHDMRADVSYIRGVLDGEAMAARKAGVPRTRS